MNDRCQVWNSNDIFAKENGEDDEGVEDDRGYQTQHDSGVVDNKGHLVDGK